MFKTENSSWDYQMNNTKTDWALKRFTTNVPRLDMVLKGGFFLGGMYLIRGAPGTGKTVLASQICFSAASEEKNAVYFSILAESSGRHIGYMEPFAFFDSGLLGTKIDFFSGYKTLKEEGLNGLFDLIKKSVLSKKAKVLVIDGVDGVECKSKDADEYREFLHKMQQFSNLTSCTVFLLSPLNDPKDGTVRAENAVSDGVLEISEHQMGPRAVRELKVLKHRGSDSLKGRHEIEISADRGFTIHPRTEVQFAAGNDTVDLDARYRMQFGVKGLDEMLHGGVLSGSMTSLLGAPGTGKTTLGLSFLTEGALNGEHGIYIGFYETPQRLIEKAEGLGIPMMAMVKKGLIEIQWQQSVENIADSIVENLLERIKQKKKQKIRVFIDGLAGLRRSLPYPERFGSLFAAMTGELRRTGATTIFSDETDLFSREVLLLNREMGSVVDNVLLLRFFELKSRMLRLISIMKVRESSYDFTIKELSITGKGVEVTRSFEQAESQLTSSGRVITQKPTIVAAKQKKTSKVSKVSKKSKKGRTTK